VYGFIHVVQVPANNTEVNLLINFFDISLILIAKKTLSFSIHSFCINPKEFGLSLNSQFCPCVSYLPYF